MKNGKQTMAVTFMSMRNLLLAFCATAFLVMPGMTSSAQSAQNRSLEERAAAKAAREPAAAPVTQEIKYVVIASPKMDNSALEIDCIFDRTQPASVLRLLGDKLYQEHRGNNYPTVIINWRLKGSENTKAPWARSIMTTSTTNVQMLR